MTVHESGSTLVLPFLQKLADPFHADYPNITLAPSGGGSGKGISDAISGTVQMGGSDAYLSDAQAKKSPGLLNIPIAISAQAINYNLPGIKDLKISGDVLAKIYQHQITKWDDPAIGALNPGVKLPSQTIIPVRRVDASGDTFIFTSLLSATNGQWKSGPAFGTTVTWPALPGELTANGNPAMIQVCKANPGCVAYIGVSVEATAVKAGLGQALLQNKSGKFLHATKATITAAVNAGAGSTPADLRAPLIYEPGDQSYAIVNYEYLMVQTKQPNPNTAMAVRTFLTWAIDANKGSAEKYLSSVDFVGLPAAVVPKVEAAIAKIGG
ncbi:MAG: phosphate ABC transporter substrate-binding protein PstS [Chloroflexota bacterium]